MARFSTYLLLPHPRPCWLSCCLARHLLLHGRSNHGRSNHGRSRQDVDLSSLLLAGRDDLLELGLHPRAADAVVACIQDPAAAAAAHAAAQAAEVAAAERGAAVAASAEAAVAKEVAEATAGVSAGVSAGAASGGGDCGASGGSGSGNGAGGGSAGAVSGGFEHLLTLKDRSWRPPQRPTKAEAKLRASGGGLYGGPGGGEKEALSMVVVGHVDAGKSTLMGQLLVSALPSRSRPYAVAALPCSTTTFECEGPAAFPPSHSLLPHVPQVSCGAVDQRAVRKFKAEASAAGKGSFYLAYVRASERTRACACTRFRAGFSSAPSAQAGDAKRHPRSSCIRTTEA